MIDFSKNHFELFELPVSYAVDSELLSSRYREMQRVLHPDKFANAPDQQRRLSMQAAARVNEAYQVLRDPMLRAKYLLLLQGVDMDAKQSTTQDMAFLMEQMELREKLEHSRSAEDPYQVIDELKRDIKKRLDVLVEQMTGKLDPISAEHLEAAEELVRKMQFLQKLHHDAESLEAELDEAY
jgi:molecular chaperone HscB